MSDIGSVHTHLIVRPLPLRSSQHLTQQPRADHPPPQRRARERTNSSVPGRPTRARGRCPADRRGARAAPACPAGRAWVGGSAVAGREGARSGLDLLSWVLLGDGYEDVVEVCTSAPDRYLKKTSR